MTVRRLFLFVALSFTALTIVSLPSNRRFAPRVTPAKAAPVESARPSDGGLREEIETRYRKRYDDWKNEFLVADIGKAQWELYNKHPHLKLTITIADKNKNGAGTGLYKWNDEGELVEATIFLGTRIDEGFPSKIYYPVMNSLESYEANQLLSHNVLAATKIAHEFGHVMKIAETPEALYKLQVKLVPQYNKIFLSNGHNVNDPKLIELASQMGGNPVQIWEDREYWGKPTPCFICATEWRKRVFTAASSIRSSARLKSTQSLTKTALPKSPSHRA